MFCRLTILLLIAGCALFKEEICVLKDDNSNKFDCYPQIDESQCISDSENKGFALIYQGKYYENCQDWCNNNDVECVEH